VYPINDDHPEPIHPINPAHPRTTGQPSETAMRPPVTRPAKRRMAALRNLAVGALQPGRAYRHRRSNALGMPLREQGFRHSRP
jgi:hypothetical protein